MRYLNFIKERGKPVSQINPGSDEMALAVDDALQAIELLKNSQTAIIGGDILSEDEGELIYAYQLWGEEYHYLNWYCDKRDNESEYDYLKRSYDIARKSVINAGQIAKRFNKKCYIVFVSE